MAKAAELVQECRRQHESCLYTSTALFAWLRSVRFWKKVFVVVPLILGGFAGSTLLSKAAFPGASVLQASCAFLAGLLPTVYAALKLEEGESEISLAAASFKNLQDRFRQAAVVSSQKGFAEFETVFEAVMERMEEARSTSLTPPERFFRKAQAKIKSGDYSFDVDAGDGE